MSIKSILADACTDLWLPSKDLAGPLPNYFAAGRPGVLYGSPVFGDDHLVLDGTNDRVREDTNAAGACQIGTPLSWLLWLNVTSLTGTRVAIRRASGYGWQFYFASGYSIYQLLSSGGNAYCVGPEASGGTTWDCYLGTWDGTTLAKVYKNGALASGGMTGAMSGTMLEATPLCLGAMADGGLPTPGKLRAGGLFNRVLTSSEVAELYDSGNGWQGLEEAVASSAKSLIQETNLGTCLLNGTLIA